MMAHKACASPIVGGEYDSLMTMGARARCARKASQLACDYLVDSRHATQSLNNLSVAGFILLERNA